MLDYLILQGLTEAQSIEFMKQLFTFFGFVVGFSGSGLFWRIASMH